MFNLIITINMGRYFYPNAGDALDAKKQFLREHHYKINHCFKNTWGTGYVLFDTISEVNQWYKEHTGSYFYKEEYEPGTTYTKSDAMKEIEATYGTSIDNVLTNRIYSCPLLAIGLPPRTAYGNRLFLKFVRSDNEEDIEPRFFIHYSPRFINAQSLTSNNELKQSTIKLLYNYFHDSYFKKREDGSENNHKASESKITDYKIEEVSVDSQQTKGIKTLSNPPMFLLSHTRPDLFKEDKPTK
jgi:hypothetical protein